MATTEHEHRYRALASRDPRFDGHFWVGVRTTGVYCRPVCPSRTPRADNVVFFTHPAAAEADGFRPCLRCRPDAAGLGNPGGTLDRRLSRPGDLLPRAVDDVVGRSLERIAAGDLDRISVPELARELGVSDRHLRRRFHVELGASPDAVARTRRAHLARRLLEETDLRVADVAFAAGFGSVRQCNAVMRATYGATPSELRAGRHGSPSFAGGPVGLRLALREPLERDALLEWFRRRSVPGLEWVDDDGAYHRRVRLRGWTGELAAWFVPGAVAVRSDIAPGASLGAIVAGVRQVLGLEADPEAVDDHLRRDELLGPLVAARPGLRAPGCWSGFEAAVRAVVGQQISVAAARTVLGRIVDLHGDGAFPEPEVLAESDLEGIGLVRARAATVRWLSTEVAAGRIRLDGSLTHGELVATLVQVPGIGDWTAEYVALRSGHPDAFPAGDLHFARVLGLDRRGVLARSERWRPWRAHAATHLWHLPTASSSRSTTHREAIPR